MSEDFTYFPPLCLAAAEQVADQAMNIGRQIHEVLCDFYKDEPAKRRPELMAATIMAIEVEMRLQLVGGAALHAAMPVDDAVQILDREIEGKRQRSSAAFRTAERKFAEEVLDGAKVPAGTVLQ